MKVLNIKAKENPDIFIPLIESMELHRIDRNYYKVLDYEKAKKIIIDLLKKKIITFNFIMETENKDEARKLFDDIRKKFFDLVPKSNYFKFEVSIAMSYDVKKCLNGIEGYSFNIRYLNDNKSRFIPEEIDDETFNVLRNSNKNNISTKLETILVPKRIKAIVGETIKIIPFTELGINFEIPNEQLVWETDNKSIAVIDNDGNIKIVGTGSTYITVSLKSNNEVNKKIYIETMKSTKIN